MTDRPELNPDGTEPKTLREAVNNWLNWFSTLPVSEPEATTGNMVDRITVAVLHRLISRFKE